ncbi:unnamed protein product [Orchesella dallaii]|uniref:Uncharacterized protein n=1 Tax=Orchesella dallaii TaxID=48710 RepID=A0ABP1S4K3_9HEXA
MSFAGGSVHSQVWLTYAITDSDVPKALTLCFSMRRVYTSRKLAVLVSRNVSPSMREVLRSIFDFFFYLEEELNTAGLKEEEFVRLSAFTLKCFGKLVFLEPSFLAVKNLDDIFDNNEVASGLLLMEVGQDEDELSIFMARPCLHVFRILMDSLKTRNGKGMEVHLRTWARHQLLPTAKPVDMKYSGKLLQASSTFLRNESDVSLVNICIPLDEVNTEPFGLCARVSNTR